ncbi:hypothetical protein BGZ61DRAFT_496440 [Ilyonectria robusta]|uniref:uncharacterized protein n=1 Tax=Ilyonectria robusta TaxID=1079257 RepID=UPI001E8CE728|nr:uncharacterized protein BGZ61DRAFT_496440 [Ilyonectria robusta]KAH8679180.1 hypothetical protein BGZ61DRAFT_496440 [Ilyonectria robusta]
MSCRQTAQPQGPYMPMRDAMDRHDYGVTKTRKASSTGGGRAWSEDEEHYLLQTRLQKMPYKYIAAHLKKTELACRLHYHQLSHGSNRRKRAASCSSAGTSNDHSPAMAQRAPSPARESVSRSASPPGSSMSYSPPPPSHGSSCIQLPSIMTSGEVPRLPAILPKPSSMTLPHPTASSQTYASPVADNHVSVSHPSAYHPPSHHRTTPPLRLDCSGLPAPAMPAHTAAHVDLSRLHSIYSAHRNSFWSAVANEYGPNVSPTVLEQAWKTGACCSQTALTPITPISSPGNGERDPQSKGQDKTRISSILGIDADPRTARDRDIVRRMEEERFGMMQPAH